MKKLLKLVMIATAVLLIGSCSEFPFDDSLDADQVVLTEESALKSTTCCPPPSPPCYPPCKEETEWSLGSPYVDKGNWAMFTLFTGCGQTVDIIAGQHMTIGKVRFTIFGDNMVLEMLLFGDWCLKGTESLKIEGYNDEPDEKPSPGKFTYKFDPDLIDGYGVVVVPIFDYYGIHMDVGCCD